MNQAETFQLGELILQMRAEGVTILLIEHDMDLINQVCDQVVALIGPNGAGKSTTLNAISGLVAVGNGRIQFNNQTINNLRADQIAALRLVQVPEGREVLALLSVTENLELGA